MRIKEVMKRYGITQDEIATRLGINRVSVSRLLSDKNDMRVSTAQKFADAIGCKVAELFEEQTDFSSYVRYNGIHYTADTLDEFFKQVEEIKAIAR